MFDNNPDGLPHTFCKTPIVCGKEPFLQTNISKIKVEAGVDQCCTINPIDKTHLTCTGPDGTGIPQIYVKAQLGGVNIGYGTNF